MPKVKPYGYVVQYEDGKFLRERILGPEERVNDFREATIFELEEVDLSVGKPLPVYLTLERPEK